MDNRNAILVSMRTHAETLLQCYSASELEDTLFSVFEEANLYEDFTYKEKEKRKLLHEALRNIFREIAANPQLFRSILKNYTG